MHPEGDDLADAYQQGIDDTLKAVKKAFVDKFSKYMDVEIEWKDLINRVKK